MIDSYWNKALTFESYLDIVLKKSVSQDETRKKYFLSLNRSRYIIDNYIPDATQVKKFQDKKFKGKVLIIAEGWCGDCSQSIPVIKKFFGNKNPVKIVFRDENPKLMQKFLTNGNEAIPIIIFISEENDVISHWGPRTKAGKEILLKHKKSLENFDKDSFLSELHNYYDTNKGYDIMNEILSIL